MLLKILIIKKIMCVEHLYLLLFYQNVVVVVDFLYLFVMVL